MTGSLIVNPLKITVKPFWVFDTDKPKTANGKTANGFWHTINY